MARGDRLAVEQRIAGSTVAYLHHGIDLGDGTVAHARPDDFRNPFGGGRVVRTSREEFAAGRPVRVTVDPPSVFPPAAIVARALQHVGRPGYSPFVDNCEHFATWCATGRRVSRQAEIVCGRLGAAAVRAIAVLSTRAAVAGGERIAVGAALGTTLRLGLRSLVPVAVASEAAALVVEWRAHQAGCPPTESRRAGEAAGMATSSVAGAVAGLPAGPMGVLAGAVAGAALWASGTVSRPRDRGPRSPRRSDSDRA